MNKFLFLVLCGLFLVGVTSPSFAESSPLGASTCTTQCSSWVNEMGLTIPTKSSTVRDYFAANSVTPNPLTSGLGYGIQAGRHLRIGSAATIGGIVAGNVYYSKTTSTTQVYNFSTYFVARGYMSETWRDGAFVEVGFGPEVSAASFTDSSFVYQANLSTRLGVGYNYQFNNDVSVGISAVVSPSVTASNYLDGSKVIVNILW